MGGYGATTAVGGALPLGPAHSLCGAGYVDGVIGGAHKCLRAGEFCSPSHESDYERYGFACVAGHLKSRAAAITTTGSSTVSQPAVSLGQTVKLGRRTQTSGCTRGALPDRHARPAPTTAA